jgi:hypothetical protein
MFLSLWIDICIVLIDFHDATQNNAAIQHTCQLINYTTVYCLSSHHLSLSFSPFAPPEYHHVTSDTTVIHSKAAAAAAAAH